MQKAVGEDHVERAEWRQIRARQIRLDELTAELRTRHLEIPLIDVHADVVDFAEVRSVRTRSTADVEHSSHRMIPQPSLNRSKLLRRKRGLPGRVHRRMFHQPLTRAHYRHLTSSVPTASEFGNMCRTFEAR